MRIRHCLHKYAKFAAVVVRNSHRFRIIFNCYYILWDSGLMGLELSQNSHHSCCYYATQGIVFIILFILILHRVTVEWHGRTIIL